MSNYIVFTDGGSRGNPGPSAGGWIVYENDNIISKGSKYFGIGTNNQAEYKAVVETLKWIKDNLKPVKLTFYLDSELVVRQLTGIYKIKDQTLRIQAMEVNNIRKEIGCQIEFFAVRREKNKLADQMVNDKLDEVIS